MAELFEREGMMLSPEIMSIDRELEELLKKQTAKVKVFGVGGGGGNTLSRMREIGIKGAELIAVNTDAQDLLYTNADYKILIGRELTIGIVTLPFSMEGKKRIENAVYGLERMESIVDTLIVIPNDKLLELAPELPLHTAFKVADEVFTN